MEAPPCQNGELYDLDNDIGESTNVAASNPKVVARLQALADAMDADLGINEIGPGCRPLGRIENPKPIISHDGKFREDLAL